MTPPTSSSCKLLMRTGSRQDVSAMPFPTLSRSSVADPSSGIVSTRPSATIVSTPPHQSEQEPGTLHIGARRRHFPRLVRSYRVTQLPSAYAVRQDITLDPT